MEAQTQQAVPVSSPWDYQEPDGVGIGLLGRDEPMLQDDRITETVAAVAAAFDGHARIGYQLPKEDEDEEGTKDTNHPSDASDDPPHLLSVHFDDAQGLFEASKANHNDEELQLEADASNNKSQLQEIILHTKTNRERIFPEIINRTEIIDPEEDLEQQQEPTDEPTFDVEEVLNKQNTHDLYCPNCHSCITRRVVLRRKKPRVPKLRPRPSRQPHPDHHQKPEPEQTIEEPVLAQPNVGSSDGRLTPDENLHRQPFIFKCLSCFTIFAPAGDGQVQYMPPSCTGWLFGIFGSNKKQPATNDDPASEEDGTDQQSPPNNRPLPPRSDETNQQAPSNITPFPYGGNETNQLPRGPGSSFSSSSSSSSSSSDGGQIQASGEGKNPNNTGDGDVQVIVELPPSDQLVTPPSPIVDAGNLTEQLIVSNLDDETHELGILKSIVYGGLTESITSLGVVTSAAATGATTLNIFAMGLANLIGGLFVIAHNLKELKSDGAGGRTTTSPHGTNKQEDRYQELLGRRQNFWLHTVLVFLSFLIFGLMPPVVYGFSFRESDDRDFKMAAAAGSSLMCILLLSVGKAHVQKSPRPYVTTVLYYVSIGVTTSGLSYVGGDLIKKLVEELHLFEPNSVKPGWASF